MKTRYSRLVISLAFVAASLVYVIWHQKFARVPDLVALLSPGMLLGIAVALALGTLLAGERLRYAAKDFGYLLRYRDCIAANAIGAAAGLMFFQIIGQIAGRTTALSRSHVPDDATAVITLYERSIALIVSASLACMGAIYLFGRIGLDVYAGGAGLVLFAAGLFCSVIAVALFAWRDLLVAHVRPLIRPVTFARIARIAAITLAIQGCTLVGYVLAVAQFTDAIRFADLAAAATIVMFAASMPISFSGWGIRELSSIAALGVIGVAPQYALTASIVIGLLSLAIILALAYWAVGYLSKPGRPSAGAATAPRSAMQGGSVARGILALGTSLLILFQLQVPIERGFLNVSLSDLFAAICGLLVLIEKLKSPRTMRSGLAVFAVLGSVLFFESYLHGLLTFGTSNWATAKLIGWFLLLSYAAAGATLARRVDIGGGERLALTLGTAGAAIVAFDALVSILIVQPPRMVGFAGNSNAFAFELLMCFAAGFVFLRDRRSWVPISAALIVGVLLTASRAGLITLACTLIACSFLRPPNVRSLCKSIFFALMAFAMVRLCQSGLVSIVVHWTEAFLDQWVFSPVVQTLNAFGGQGIGSSGFHKIGSPSGHGYLHLLSRTEAGNEFSNAERWRTIVGGFQLFISHPLFGAGLGNFYEHFARADGAPLVIHSVSVWILAEFGLVGAAACILFVVAMMRRIEGVIRNDAALLMLLVGLIFGIFGTVHDIFYQRTFWFLLGAALAVTSWATAAEQQSSSVVSEKAEAMKEPVTVS